jgi:hypothetical protein
MFILCICIFWIINSKWLFLYQLDSFHWLTAGWSCIFFGKLPNSDECFLQAFDYFSRYVRRKRLSAHGCNQSCVAILWQEFCSSNHTVTIELVVRNREYSTFQPLGIFPFQGTNSDAFVLGICGLCKLRLTFCISHGSYWWAVPCHRNYLWGSTTIAWMSSCSVRRNYANLVTCFSRHPVVSVGQISCWNYIRCIHVYSL